MAESDKGHPSLNFKKERLNRGLSQRAMAAEIGITFDAYRSLEAGARLRPANALKVAEFFNTTVVELWPLDEVA